MATLFTRITVEDNCPALKGVRHHGARIRQLSNWVEWVDAQSHAEARATFGNSKRSGNIAAVGDRRNEADSPRFRLA